MAQKFVTLICYWGGEICDGPEGVAYNNFPKKAIKVRCGVKYNEFIDQVRIATSIDKLRSRINVICRYPTVVGKVMRYVPLPIADDNDVEIMFDVFSLHQELSSIDVYLEVEINGPGRNEEITDRTQEPVLSANEASLPTMRHANVVSDMNQNQGFNGFDTHEIAFVDDGLEGDEVDNDVQVPSPSTNTEGVDMATADNWTMSRSKKGKNDLTRELGKEIFKDKEELIRDIKLYTIQKRKQYEVVEARSTVWRIRCKFWSQCSCKWQVRACKRKRTGYYQITQYAGPHTCSDNEVTQDHANLDSSFIAQEIEHIIKEKPNISIPALRSEIIDKLGYTASYKKVWHAKRKAVEHIFGKSEESDSPNLDVKCRGKGRPRSTSLGNGMDVNGEKLANLCGICRQRGHNRKPCPSKPSEEPTDP